MGGEFVEVYRGGGGQFRAEMLRSLLSGSGIESIIDGGGTGGGLPTTVGMSSEFRLIVRAEDAERATGLLASFDDEGAEFEEPEWMDDDGPDEPRL